MRKLICTLTAVALVGGCAAEPKAAKPSPLRPTPKPTRPTTKPTPATVAARPGQPNVKPPALPTPVANSGAGTTAGADGRVVEIITKPRLATRPTTSAPAGGGGAPAARTSEAAVSSADVPAPRFTLDTLARTDTAVSCAPLLRLLAMKLNGIPYESFAGYGALDFSPKLPEGTNPDAMTNDVLAREPGGTAAAIKRLTKGEIDLALVPRVPNADEIAAAAAAKVRLRYDLIATEALVFTVNAANPVNALSRDQLAKIFNGQAKLWKDLGEKTVPLNERVAGEPITVAYRARGTGSEELLRQLLLQGKAMPELPVSRALSASKLVLDASVEDPETIGFSVFAYASNMKRDGRVKVLAIDGVVPEPSRVAGGDYPLTTPIYVLTRADLGAEKDLYKMRAWLSSMNGQKALAEAGYMPVSSEAWTAVRLMGK